MASRGGYGAAFSKAVARPQGRGSAHDGSSCFCFRGGELAAIGRGAAIQTSACASHVQRRVGAPRPGQTINDGGARALQGWSAHSLPVAVDSF
jgi:hypothetical protein